jgi:hypothetical protein
MTSTAMSPSFNCSKHHCFLLLLSVILAGSFFESLEAGKKRKSEEIAK